MVVDISHMSLKKINLCKWRVIYGTDSLYIIIVYGYHLSDWNYVYHVSVGKRTFADPVFDKMDNFVFRILKIDTSNDDLEKICYVIVDGKFMPSFHWVFDFKNSINWIFKS